MNVKGLSVLLLVAALAVVLVVRVWERSTEESAVARETSSRSMLVETVQASVGVVNESIQAVGTLQAIASIMIRPEISGIVRRIHFSDGQLVDRLAPLVQLDQEELQAEANQAVAQERLAQLTYERLKRLSAQQTTIVPAQQVDEARLALQAATANSVLFGTRLKKSLIKAPFAGTMGLRRVSVGDYVQPGQDLVNLEDLQTLHVDFKVPEVWLSRLSINQAVGVATDAFPGMTFQGTVTAIDPRVDSVNRTIAVRAVVPNQDGRLRPGLFATVSVRLGQDLRAVLIPEEAVFIQRDRSMTYRVQDGSARLVELVIGAHERGLVQVKEGLSAGDQVVRTGTHKLHDGMAVVTK
ncbi:MAG: efflux RND transporter periplasmic adaptor subunit [Nitrospira sp.]|nr:efflux RND transporter periplasmic adaptor subunit [Nitrospira sp.]